MNNDNSIMALRTLMEVKNYENMIQKLRYELYNSNVKLDLMVEHLNEILEKPPVVKKNIFNKLKNEDDTICDVKYCNNQLLKHNNDSYKVITKDGVYREYRNRSLTPTKHAVVCTHCNNLIIKNSMSFDSINNITEEEWNYLQEYGYLEYLDYDKKIELLQKENKELREKNIECRELLVHVIENKLDNSHIVLELLKKSDFYNNLDNPLVKLKEI